MDKLIVKGLPPLDGEYPCDVVGMMIVGHPEALTNREAHRVKQMTGLRAGELLDAFEAGDNDITVAFAAVVLGRNRRTFDDGTLWDAPVGSGIRFEFGNREDEEVADEALPPPENAPSEPLS